MMQHRGWPRFGWQLASLLALGLGVACGGDEGGGGGDVELGGACQSNDDCDVGVCAAPAGGEGKCRTTCPRAGQRCGSGSFTCFASVDTDNNPVNVCAAQGCT